MKFRTLVYFSALVATILSGCSSDDKDLPETKQVVSFSTTISSNTRAANDAWTTGDKVGVYMIPEGGTLATALASNKKYTASAAGELTYDSEDQAIYFPVDGSKVNFVTYYPYTATVSNNQIAVDVTNQTSQEAIDLLYAPTTTGFNNASTKVNLNFTHQLTRMVLNITKASNVTLTNFSVKLVGTETKAAFDLATGTLTTTAGNVDSIAYKLTDKGNNQYQAEAIVLPNSKLPDDAAIEFTIGTQTFKTSLAAASLNAGSSYSYPANISDNAGKLVVAVGQATITNWITVPGSDINIDLGGGTTPTDPSGGTETTIFTETFGTVVKVGNYWPHVNEYTGWDNPTFTFTDSYLSGSYSNADVRSTSTMDSHVWFAATKNSGLKISGFSTSGYTNLKLSYSIAANVKSVDQNVIQVKCDSTVMTVPSVSIPATNLYQTVELSNVPVNTTSIEFISSATTNTAGYRIDNVKLVGTK